MPPVRKSIFRLGIILSFQVPVLLSWGSAAAQGLRGRVADAGTALPVPHSVVSLQDSAGAELARTLSSEAGQFGLRVSGPGRYRIAVHRIGYRTSYSDFFHADPKTDRYFELHVEAVPVKLDGIAVTGERTCARTPAAADILRVWTEARKALTAARLAEQERALIYSGVTFSRRVQPSGSVSRQVLEPFRNRSGQPYVSLPVEDLLGNGFIRAAGSTFDYYAPGAQVLLSAAFENAYCFSLVRRDAAHDLIGVRFTPNRVHADVAAITGTAWLDASNARLRSIEFGYTKAAGVPYADLAEGVVEFLMLPNGVWTVSRWSVRIPSALREEYFNGRRTDARVAEFFEKGGEVRDVVGRGIRWSIVAPGAIAGVVYDSTRLEPLAGARVLVSGASLTATTDAKGRFHIPDVPAGTYSLGFAHARLDSLPSYGPLAAEVQVVPATTAAAVLAIPPLSRSALGACMPAAPGVTSLFGLVREADTGRLIPGASVTFDWQAFIVNRTAIGAAGRELTVQADADGRYVACGLPADALVRAHPRIPGRQTATLPLRTRAEPSFFRVDVASADPTIPATAPDSTIPAATAAAADAVRLDQLTVEARRLDETLAAVGFYSRQSQPGGRYFERGQIERMGGRVVSDLLRGMAGVVLTPGQAGQMRVAIRGGERVSRGGLVTCGPRLIVDGSEVEPGGGSSTAIDAAIRLQDVAGIEVYRRVAEIPTQFSGAMSACGVIVIWSRSGRR